MLLLSSFNRVAALFLGAVFALVSAAHAAPAAPPTPAAETTFYLDPLRSDGFVDYAAAINQELKPAGITPDQNVFVGLLEQSDTEHWDPAYLAHLSDRLGDFFVPIPDVPFVVFDRFVTAQGIDAQAAAAERQGAWTTPFDAATAPVTARWLDAMEPALDGVATALQRPHYYLPLVRSDPRDPLVHALLPHLEVLRAMGTALRLRGFRRLAQGDVDGATHDLMALRRLAAWASHGPSVPDGLVAFSAGRGADELLAGLYGHRDFQRAHFMRLSSEPWPASRPMSTTVGRFARALVLDTTTQAACDPTSLAEARAAMTVPDTAAEAQLWAAVARVIGDPRFDLAGLLGQINFLYDEMPDRRDPETLAKFTQRVDRYRAILARRGPSPDESAMLASDASKLLSDTEFPVAQAGVFKVMTSLPIVGDVEPLRLAQVVHDQGVVTSVARVVEDFALGRGHYPASLDPLTPGYIRELPSDPGDGAALRYVADDDGQGFTLYSVGPDGQDGGGVGGDDLVFRVRR